MIARPVNLGWQTLLADLSLILFMVTAAALADAPDGPLDSSTPVVRAPAIRPAPRAVPVGVWRPLAGGPSLTQWLNEAARDPRLQLTITVHYAPGGQAEALAAAARLNHEAGANGGTARVVIEPGEPAGIGAVLGYDADRATGTQIADHGA